MLGRADPTLLVGVQGLRLNGHPVSRVVTAVRPPSRSGDHSGCCPPGITAQIALADVAPPGRRADVVAVPFQRTATSCPRARGRRAPRRARRRPLRAPRAPQGEGHGRRGGRARPCSTRAGLTASAPAGLLLVGVGEARPGDLRRAGAALARRTKGRETVATSLAALAHDAGLRAFVEGLVLGSFTFHRRSTGPDETARRRAFVLAGLATSGPAQVALARALATAGAGWLSRTLALVPSNEKNPPWMAEQAERIAAELRAVGRGLGRAAPRRGGVRRPARGRPGVGDPAPAGAARDTPRRAGRAGPRTWCSSARASRSTPAGCRSSPARR